MSALRTTLLSKPVKSAKPAKPILSRRYHMHSGGVFYIVVTVLLGIGSINSQNNLLFIVFGIALGAMLVSGIVSGAMMMGLEIERRPISPAQVGSNARFSYRLRNKRRRVPAMAIDLIEADRPRRKLRRRARAKPQVEAFIDVASPKSVVDLSAVMPCRERGIIRLDPITISTTFPFGIVLKSVTVTAPDELLVLPRVVDLPPSLLLSGGGGGRTETERHDQRGLRPRSPPSPTARPPPTETERHDRRGLGLEFYAIRDYQPGDPMRRIAWKQSARSGTLRTREFASPVAASIMIDLALDAEPMTKGAASDHESEAERAITLAASLATLASRCNIGAGLRVPQLGIDIEPSQSQERTSAILEALARIDLTDQRLATPADPLPVSQELRLVRVQSASSAAPRPAGAQVFTTDLLDRAIPRPESGNRNAREAQA